MNTIPPLLEVELTLHYPQIAIPEEKLQYLRKANSSSFPFLEGCDSPASAILRSADGKESFVVSRDRVQMLSREGSSFPRMKPSWTPCIDSFLDVFGVPEVDRISLVYMNEIQLHNLRSFREYLNIGFEMPQALMERIEFFRSEFTYKYDFGEIHVWLQPDWNEKCDSYCIQLNLESRYVGVLARKDVVPRILQLHEGIKDVFHQVLSRDYIDRLPQ